MSDFNNNWTQGFDALSKQYWNAWSDMARQGGVQPSPTDGWKQMLETWAPWARNGRSTIDDAVERMTSQGGTWFGQMQQVAQQFARGQANVSDIMRSWKDMFGGSGGNPFAGVFPQGAGTGTQGFEHWLQQINPMLDNMRAQWRGTLDMPAFGHAREQQERLQSFVQAQGDYRQAMAAYTAVLFQAGQRSFEVFENKLTERSEPGRQIDSARALFDLWIDAVEQAWSEIALSADYRRVYGELANAQTRVKGGVQDMIERATGQLGMPTRTEVNSSHRKVTQLEREVRELKQRLAALEKRGENARTEPSRATVARNASVQAQPTAGTALAPAKKVVKKKTAKKKIAKKKTAKTVAAKKPAAKKATSKKTTAKKSTSKKSTSKKTTASSKPKRRSKSTAIPKAVMPKAPIPKAPGSGSAKKVARTAAKKTVKESTRKSSKR
ncbi:MAG: class III poly(R)-hydroxyalkanoic acid synthase subunit PhaE [Lysobacteraceae bacterium]